MRFLARDNFPQLLEVLQQAGYTCIAPQIRDANLVYDEITQIEQLPINYQDQQSPGRYLISENGQQRYFAWANGAEAVKPMTFASREALWKVKRDAGGKLNFEEILPESKPLAIIGVKSCDLAALHLQDQHFAFNTFGDRYYNLRRRALIFIAVDCSHPAETCFCASTGDGPDVRSGFDVALTELDDGFLIRTKSQIGKDIAAQLPLHDATTFQLSQAAKQQQQARDVQHRQLPSRHLKESLFNNLEHSRWQEIGERCLACGNCTSVCPTCFCHNEVEDAQLDGTESAHYRQWDSCFTLGHSYMHSVVLRKDIYLRYRQWLTHKLGSWHEQYGRSGCVGCGRCITWCPVGIDITEEVQTICQGELSCHK